MRPHPAHRVYVVVCQDAIGHRAEHTVRAATDEQACTQALHELNSWKAIRAMPATTPSIQAVPPLERAVDDTPTERATGPEPTIGPRIIHTPDVPELVREHRGSVGRLGEAMRRAAA